MKLFTCQPDSHNAFVRIHRRTVTYFEVPLTSGDAGMSANGQPAPTYGWRLPKHFETTTAASGTSSNQLCCSVANRSVCSEHMTIIGSTSGVLAVLLVERGELVYAPSFQPGGASGGCVPHCVSWAKDGYDVFMGDGVGNVWCWTIVLRGHHPPPQRRHHQQVMSSTDGASAAAGPDFQFREVTVWPDGSSSSSLLWRFCGRYTLSAALGRPLITSEFFPRLGLVAMATTEDLILLYPGALVVGKGTQHHHHTAAPAPSPTSRSPTTASSPRRAVRRRLGGNNSSDVEGEMVGEGHAAFVCSHPIELPDRYVSTWVTQNTFLYCHPMHPLIGVTAAIQEATQADDCEPRGCACLLQIFQLLESKIVNFTTTAASNAIGSPRSAGIRLHSPLPPAASPSPGSPTSTTMPITANSSSFFSSPSPRPSRLRRIYSDAFNAAPRLNSPVFFFAWKFGCDLELSLGSVHDGEVMVVRFCTDPSSPGFFQQSQLASHDRRMMGPQEREDEDEDEDEGKVWECRLHHRYSLPLSLAPDVTVEYVSYATARLKAPSASLASSSADCLCSAGCTMPSSLPSTPHLGVSDSPGGRRGGRPSFLLREDAIAEIVLQQQQQQHYHMAATSSPISPGAALAAAPGGVVLSPSFTTLSHAAAPQHFDEMHAAGSGGDRENGSSTNNPLRTSHTLIPGAAPSTSVVGCSLATGEVRRIVVERKAVGCRGNPQSSSFFVASGTTLHTTTTTIQRLRETSDAMLWMRVEAGFGVDPTDNVNALMRITAALPSSPLPLVLSGGGGGGGGRRGSIAGAGGSPPTRRAPPLLHPVSRSSISSNTAAAGTTGSPGAASGSSREEQLRDTTILFRYLCALESRGFVTSTDDVPSVIEFLLGSKRKRSERAVRQEAKRGRRRHTLRAGDDSDSAADGDADGPKLGEEDHEQELNLAEETTFDYRRALVLDVILESTRQATTSNDSDRREQCGEGGDPTSGVGGDEGSGTNNDSFHHTTPATSSCCLRLAVLERDAALAALQGKREEALRLLHGTASQPTHRLVSHYLLNTTALTGLCQRARDVGVVGDFLRTLSPWLTVTMLSVLRTAVDAAAAAAAAARCSASASPPSLPHHSGEGAVDQEEGERDPSGVAAAVLVPNGADDGDEEARRRKKKDLEEQEERQAADEESARLRTIYHQALDGVYRTRSLSIWDRVLVALLLESSATSAAYSSSTTTATTTAPPFWGIPAGAQQSAARAKRRPPAAPPVPPLLPILTFLVREVASPLAAFTLGYGISEKSFAAMQTLLDETGDVQLAACLFARIGVRLAEEEAVAARIRRKLATPGKKQVLMKKKRAAAGGGGDDNEEENDAHSADDDSADHRAGFQQSHHFRQRQRQRQRLSLSQPFLTGVPTMSLDSHESSELLYSTDSSSSLSSSSSSSTTTSSSSSCSSAPSAYTMNDVFDEVEHHHHHHHHHYHNPWLCWAEAYRMQLDEAAALIPRASFDVGCRRLSLQVRQRNFSVPSTQDQDPTLRTSSSRVPSSSTSSTQGTAVAPWWSAPAMPPPTMTPSQYQPQRELASKSPACSICRLPALHGLGDQVEDALAWCRSCGHGGHANHVRCWFLVHSICPVNGCFCRCSEAAAAKKGPPPYDK